jgi:AraC family transcriptional regulator
MRYGLYIHKNSRSEIQPLQVVFVKIVEEPKVKMIEERTVAYVSFVGNYLGNAKVFEGLFQTLCDFAAPLQLNGSNTLFLSAYYNDPDTTPPEELRVDVCMTITDDADLTTEGEVHKKQLPGGKYVVMYAELSGAEEYGPAWSMVGEWMMNNNLEMDVSRPGYEIYRKNPEDDPKNHHWVEICMAVK